MKERPILFSGPMVRAIKERRKTQTRRVVKPQPATLEARHHENLVEPWHWSFEDAAECRLFEHHKKPLRPGWMYTSWPACTQPTDIGSRSVLTKPQPVWRCPYGVPGDRLWVRETWACSQDYDGVPITGMLADSDTIWWRASLPTFPEGMAACHGKWRPSIHMPRMASRILLEVTSVRVERVQEITDADAEAEGVDITNASIPGYLRERFRRLWDSINAKRGEKIKIGDPWDGWIWGTSPGDDPEALALDIGKPGEIRWRNLADHDEAEWMRFADSQPTGKGMYDVIWEKGDEPMRVYLEKCPEKEGVNYKLLKFDWDMNPWVWVIGFKLLEVKT